MTPLVAWAVGSGLLIVCGGMMLALYDWWLAPKGERRAPWR